MVNYSYKIDSKVEARTMGRDWDVSHKNAVAVAKAVRHMTLEDARIFLEAVIDKRQAVKTSPRKAGHRKGKGFGPGRYPVNTAIKFRELILDLENNAEQHLGVGSPSQLRIVHVSAQKGPVTKGTIPRARGRATPHNKDSVHLELVVRKIEGE